MSQEFPFNASPFADWASLEGAWFPATTGAYTAPAALISTFQNVSVRFVTNSASISVTLFANGQKWMLLQDGKLLATYADNNAATWQTVALATGLSGTHEYVFTRIGGGSQTTCYLYSVTLDDGCFPTAKAARYNRILGYGDSLMEGISGLPADSSQGFFWRLAGIAWHHEVVNLGISGTTVLATGQTDANIANVSSFAFNADACVVCYGTNDLAQVSGAETVGQFQTAYQTMLTKLRAALPPTAAGLLPRLYCQGILPRKDYLPAQIAPWNAAIQAAIAAVGDANTVYVETSTWVNTASDLAASDNVHMSQVGVRKYVAQMLARFPDAYPAVAGTIAPNYTYRYGSNTPRDNLRFLLGDHRGTLDTATGWLFGDEELDLLLTLCGSNVLEAARVCLQVRLNREAMSAGVAGTTDTSLRPAALREAMDRLDLLRYPGIPITPATWARQGEVEGMVGDAVP